LKILFLGASTLLDIGIYPLTWAIIGLEGPLEDDRRGPTEKLRVVATSALADGVDVATSIMLQHMDGRQGIATSHSGSGMKTPPQFCRIEGSKGTIVIEGIMAPMPSSFVLQQRSVEDEKFEFEGPGKGFHWEADAVALDIANGRKESDTMPWAETSRVMEWMDEFRRQAGVLFFQDQL
jgi:predicted dehydrogenase